MLRGYIVRTCAWWNLDFIFNLPFFLRLNPRRVEVEPEPDSPRTTKDWNRSMDVGPKLSPMVCTVRTHTVTPPLPPKFFRTRRKARRRRVPDWFGTGRSRQGRRWRRTVPEQSGVNLLSRPLVDLRSKPLVSSWLPRENGLVEVER